MISGPGTGTSDSILAFADGGFVLNAQTTRRLRGFAEGGDVLNRDFAFSNSSTSMATDAATVEAVNRLSDKIDRTFSLLLYWVKNPPDSRAVLDKKQSAAVLNAAQYDIDRGRLQ